MTERMSLLTKNQRAKSVGQISEPGLEDASIGTYYILRDPLAARGIPTLSLYVLWILRPPFS
jgi:hypothetical protein